MKVSYEDQEAATKRLLEKTRHAVAPLEGNMTPAATSDRFDL